MIRTLSIALIIAVVIVACSKDKFQTKPTLKLKSMSGNVVPPDGALRLEFEFTDKEGDVDDTLFVKKIRLNKQKVLTLRDSFGLQVPGFPKNNKGELQVEMGNTFYLASAANPPKDPVTGKPQPDTLILKFALKDRANNVSDTVTSSQVIVIRQ